MKINELIVKRFNELDDQSRMVHITRGKWGESVDTGSFHQWGTSVLSLLRGAFGPESVHFQNFKEVYDTFGGHGNEARNGFGVFKAAKADYEGGYVLSLERSLTGEVFADFVSLAKEALRQDQKDVAAVLACAALEDTLKRYAKLQGLTVDDKEMGDVVCALKSKGLVGGAQKTLLDTMPKIRNYAMHANWDKITPQDVNSVIGFVEQFLISNF